MAKKTKKVMDFLVEGVRRNEPIKELCAAAGISRHAFYDWCKKDNTFNTRVNDAKHDFQSRHLKIIEIAAKKGDWRASAWMLEKRCPDSFGRKIEQEIKVSGEIGVNLNLSDKEKKAIIQREMKRRGNGEKA